MSRIGKKVITVPKGVKVDIRPDSVEVQGPKGKLRQPFPAGIAFALEGDSLQAKTLTEDPQLGKFHGLARSLIANAVRGVTEGFRKDLDIVGVGYRAELKGKQVHFALGYSHPVVFDIPPGSTSRSTSRRTSRSLASIASRSARSRRTFVACASRIPYKQKGVRYTGEVLKKKAGKTGAK